jgi:hypothetical protein
MSDARLMPFVRTAVGYANFGANTMKMPDLLAKTARVSKATKQLIIVLANGVSVSIPLQLIGSFEKSEHSVSNAYLNVQVEDDGLSIVWPDLDIDFSVNEMVPEFLGIVTARASAKKAAAKLSPARAAAARANGAKGGRPRKAPHAGVR